MKSRFNKWIIGMAAATVMLAFAIPVSAADNMIQISSDISLVKPGESFEVNVTYGGNFNGVDMHLSYNSDLVEVADMGSGIENAIISQSDNAVYMNASSVNALSARNGNMLSVKFITKEEKSGNAGIALTVQDLFLNNGAYEPVDLSYDLNDQISHQGGILIQNEDAKAAVVKTPNGTAEISGLPENVSISVEDHSDIQERVNHYSEAINHAVVFKDAEKTDLLMVYDISAGDAGFVNGKGTVSIPLGEDQKDYDSYYVGREVDGEMVWQKAQKKDGNVVYTTDRLGEVSIVGVKGNDKVSSAYEEKADLISGDTLPYLFGAVIILIVIGVVFLVRKVKKSKEE